MSRFIIFFVSLLTFAFGSKAYTTQTPKFGCETYETCYDCLNGYSNDDYCVWCEVKTTISNVLNDSIISYCVSDEIGNLSCVQTYYDSYIAVWNNIEEVITIDCPNDSEDNNDENQQDKSNNLVSQIFTILEFCGYGIIAQCAINYVVFIVTKYCTNNNNNKCLKFCNGLLYLLLILYPLSPLTWFIGWIWHKLNLGKIISDSSNNRLINYVSILSTIIFLETMVAVVAMFFFGVPSIYMGIILNILWLIIIIPFYLICTFCFHYDYHFGIKRQNQQTWQSLLSGCICIVGLNGIWIIFALYGMIVVICQSCYLVTKFVQNYYSNHIWAQKMFCGLCDCCCDNCYNYSDCKCISNCACGVLDDQNPSNTMEMVVNQSNVKTKSTIM